MNKQLHTFEKQILIYHVKNIETRESVIFITSEKMS